MLRPSDIHIPSATRIRQLLNQRVDEVEKITLNDLPPGARISLALDAWTSPNKLTFMAVTGYFINADWKYREALLRFKPLSGLHTGKYLANVLKQVLE